MTIVLILRTDNCRLDLEAPLSGPWTVVRRCTRTQSGPLVRVAVRLRTVDHVVRKSSARLKVARRVHSVVKDTNDSNSVRHDRKVDRVSMNAATTVHLANVV